MVICDLNPAPSVRARLIQTAHHAVAGAQPRSLRAGIRDDLQKLAVVENRALLLSPRRFRQPGISPAVAELIRGPICREADTENCRLSHDFKSTLVWFLGPDPN